MSPDKPHYTFGFNLVGRSPYRIPHELHQFASPPAADSRADCLRKEESTSAMHYPAQQTGFTWDEARTVFRWEGQFWIYEREYYAEHRRSHHALEYAPRVFGEAITERATVLFRGR